MSFLIRLLICIFSVPVVQVTAQQNRNQARIISTGITGKVFDGKTGQPLPARVEIYDSTRKLQNTYYSHLPGIFTEEDGSFHQSLPPGTYTLRISHGIDYLSQLKDVTIVPGKTGPVEIYLDNWVPLKEKGWINGEAHAHLYTEKRPDTAMLAGVRKICRAQGVDFICAAQGWAGADDDSWRRDYDKISDDSFLMYYGAEMPKYRTGHYFWIGLESTKGYFGHLIDSAYETLYYQSADASHWTFDSLPFHTFPDVEVVPRFSADQDAVAIIAHPTRWWMQERERSVKYTTNAIASPAFSLLSGKPADGLVVMGDVKDHYSYQNLWFNILNLGYRMPAFSELDGGYLPGFKYPYGLMRTYFRTDTAKETMPAVVDAVRKGRTFVTTGPMILANIDRKFDVGDIIEANGQAHTLHFEAFASGDPEDYLSYIIIFRNGRIWKKWDLREKKQRSFVQDLAISEKERAWYVLKAYGKKAWKDAKNLEVMGWFDRKYAPESADRDVCITSPFYFRKKGEKNPPALVSRINLSLTGQDAGADGRITISRHGREIGKAEIRRGKAKFSMPVDAVIQVEVPGAPIVHRSLSVHYPPYLRLIEPLANGDWQKDSRYRDKVQAGYIPWEVYNFEAVRSVLKDVEWKISLQPDKRDLHWSAFEKLFREP